MVDEKDKQAREDQFKHFLNALIGVQVPNRESEELAERTQETVNYEIENQKLSLEIRRTNKKRRDQWDHVLLTLVVFGFILSYLIIVLIGFGLMRFESTFAVPTVVAAGILQTYGLAKIAAQYFFSDDGMNKVNKNK